MPDSVRVQGDGRDLPAGRGRTKLKNIIPHISIDAWIGTGESAS